MYLSLREIMIQNLAYYKWTNYPFFEKMKYLYSINNEDF